MLWNPSNVQIMLQVCAVSLIILGFFRNFPRLKIALSLLTAVAASLFVALLVLPGESPGKILGIGYCAIYLALIVLEDGIKSTLSPQNIVAFGINLIALSSTDIRIIFAALACSLLTSVWGNLKGAPRTGWPYFVLNLLGLVLAFYFTYTDLRGFGLEGNMIMHRTTLTIVCLSSLLRIGIFPTHLFIRSQIVSKGTPALVDLLNPAIFYLPFLIVENLTTGIEINIWETLFFVLGAVSSHYFALLSFSEKNFRAFLFYLSSSLFTLVISSLIYLETELVPGANFFYLSALVAFSGLFMCIEIIHSRYGTQTIRGVLGLSWQNSSVAYLFLFFTLVLSNMPLTLSFIGEDIILYELYQHHLLLGVIGLINFSLVGISLYRFYGRVFCGPYDSRLEGLPLLKREKVAMSTLLFFALASMFSPLFI